jgi:hypothetical protein
MDSLFRKRQMNLLIELAFLGWVLGLLLELAFEYQITNTNFTTLSKIKIYRILTIAYHFKL